ncbi:MAG: hypothetical protein J3Q66DRAFT_406115 [Benniella sp.]|nr:MAG: hypothetical protein J3Q66DRAFT_406115 [Benniella sp.]
MPKLPAYLLNVKYPTDCSIYRGNVNKALPPEQPEHYPYEYIEERELRMLRYRRAIREHTKPESPVPKWEQEKEEDLLSAIEEKMTHRLKQRMRNTEYKDPNQGVLRPAPPADLTIRSTPERHIKRHIEENRYMDDEVDPNNKAMMESFYPKGEREYVLFAELYYPNELNAIGKPGRRKECKVPIGLLDGRLNMDDVYPEPNNYHPKEHVALVRQLARQEIAQRRIEARGGTMLMREFLSKWHAQFRAVQEPIDSRQIANGTDYGVRATAYSIAQKVQAKAQAEIDEARAKAKEAKARARSRASMKPATTPTTTSPPEAKATTNTTTAQATTTTTPAQATTMTDAETETTSTREGPPTAQDLVSATVTVTAQSQVYVYMWNKGQGTNQVGKGAFTVTHTQEAFSLEEARSLAGLYARVKATQEANHRAYMAAFLAGGKALNPDRDSTSFQGWKDKSVVVLVTGDPVERPHNANHYLEPEVARDIERQVEDMTYRARCLRAFAKSTALAEAKVQAEARVKKQAKGPVKAPVKGTAKEQVQVRAKAPVQAPAKGQARRQAPLPAPSSTRKHAREEDEEEDEPLQRRRRTGKGEGKGAAVRKEPIEKAVVKDPVVKEEPVEQILVKDPVVKEEPVEQVVGTVDKGKRKVARAKA